MPISMLESVVSNAERRALAAGETTVVPRILDIYAALPSMTGKLELEYEGELKGADVIGRELIRGAVSHVFDGHFPDADVRQVVEWFDLGGSLNLGDLEPADEVIAEAKKVQGLVDLARRAGLPGGAPAPWLAAAIDFVLEGLYAQKKISRSDGRGFHGADTARRQQPPDRRTPVLMPDDDDDLGSGDGGGGRKKKRYYN
jgi:magnesium chelatase subunit I